MWPRVVELMLGIWLAIAPFALGMGESDPWIQDLVLAALVCGTSVLSYWRPTRHARWVTMAAAIWLMGVGWLSTPPTPASQNHLVVGMLLAMLAIVPNACNEPPERWRDELRRAA